MRVRREATDPYVRELLDAVRKLPCDFSRRQMQRTLQRMTGHRLYITRRDLVAPDELAIALTLMTQMRMAEARDALMQRLGCGRTKAYRLITSALQARAGVLSQTEATPEGLRQIALALDEGED